MNNEEKGIFFSVLTSLSIGFNIIVGKLLVNIVNVETMNTLWFMSASILFILFFILSGRKKSFKIILERKKEIFFISILSAAGSILWAYGIVYVGPNNLAFILQLTTVFIVIMGFLFLKERFTKLEFVGIIIAIGGALALAYNNSEMNLVGIMIALGVAVCYSVSNLISKVYVKRIDPLTMSGGRAIFIFLLVFGYALVTNRLQTSIPLSAFPYAFLGALTGAFLGFIFFFKALEKIKISSVMTIRTMEPFLTVVFSFFILSVSPTQNQILGGALIVIGVAILSLFRGR